MRNLTAEEWMIVSGGHPSEQPGGLQEVTVEGRRYRFKDPHSGPPYWMNASYWASQPYGMRPAGYHDDQGGGDSSDQNEDAIEVKKENEHKIDACKLGVPVDHLVPPKGWVASKQIGASDIQQAWGKALGNFSNADLQAIKSGLEVIRDGLPS